MEYSLWYEDEILTLLVQSRVGIFFILFLNNIIHISIKKQVQKSHFSTKITFFHTKYQRYLRISKKIRTFARKRSIT